MLQFGPGIGAAGMGVSEYHDVGGYGRYVILDPAETPGRVFLLHYFDTGHIEEIRFADGTVWTDQTIATKLPTSLTGGNDTWFGLPIAEFIYGLGGNDTIHGSSGHDTLDGGTGTDMLFGDGGNDVYLFGRGYGQDTVSNIFDGQGTTDALSFAADILPGDVSLYASGDDVIAAVSGFVDQVRLQDYRLGGVNAVEEIRFANGTIWDPATVEASLSGFPITGTSGPDTLQGTVWRESISGLAGGDTVYGAGGDDTIDGGLGSDTLYGEDGNDTLRAGTGEANNANVTNYLYGGTGNDVLVASGKPDSLYGEDGNDVMLGAAAAELMQDYSGSNLFFGLAAVDTLRAGDGNDLIIGGTGNDPIDGDFDADGLRGRDIVAFNKSDGQDSVTRLGTGSTISIGGGTTYSNLSFEVQGTTLRLKTTNSNYISLTDWFGSPANQTVTTLQIVIEGTNNYNAGSSNPMNNKKIQVFDFAGLVAAYDAAGRPSNFNIANNLPTFRLWGSDTDAYGGALAYQYARTSTLGTLTYDQMQTVLGDPNFGVGAQSIAPPAALMGGSTASTDASSQSALDAMMSEIVAVGSPAQSTDETLFG